MAETEGLSQIANKIFVIPTNGVDRSTHESAELLNMFVELRQVLKEKGYTFLSDAMNNYGGLINDVVVEILSTTKSERRSVELSEEMRSSILEKLNTTVRDIQAVGLGTAYILPLYNDMSIKNVNLKVQLLNWQSRVATALNKNLKSGLNGVLIAQPIQK